MSIFNGIDEILDNWLGLIGHGNRFGGQAGVPKYKSKTTTIALSEKRSPMNGQADNDSAATLISDCINQMENNLDELRAGTMSRLGGFDYFGLVWLPAERGQMN